MYKTNGEKNSMDIKFVSKGKASHSSMPENGFNAIDPFMSLLLDANKVFCDEKIKQDSMAPLIFNITIIKGESQVNSIPNHATAEVNARTIPEYDNEKIISELSKLVHLMKQTMTPYTKEIKISPISPVTDASNLVQGKPDDFPFIISGPDNDTSHQVNENVDKQM